MTQKARDSDLEQSFLGALTLRRAGALEGAAPTRSAIGALFSLVPSVSCTTVSCVRGPCRALKVTPSPHNVAGYAAEGRVSHTIWPSRR
eukprot:15385193-Alexandrium_andersonii.AAC.1